MDSYRSRRIMRVRPSHLGGTCAVRHPETGMHVVPSPAETYYSDHAIVRAYPWLFVEADDERAAEVPASPQYVETAALGRGRTRRRA